MDWQTYLFDPRGNWIARFDRMAKRRLIDVNLADQAVEHILAKLQHDNWARLGSFQAAHNAEAFLICVFRRLLEDFAIARFGKCRPPVWVQQLGLVWQTMYKRLCCERQLLESVLSRSSETQAQQHELRQIAQVIKAKLPRCGERTQFVSLDDDDAPEYSDGTQQTPTTHYEQALCNDIVDALSRLLRNDLNASVATPSIDASLLSSIELDSDTRLLLKMTYQDEISLPKAALILGIAEHTARRQIKRALSQIEEQLKQAGFSWQDWNER